VVEWVEIGNARLALGDCREILPTLPKVDAVDNSDAVVFSQQHEKPQKGNEDRAAQAKDLWESRRAEILTLYVDGSKSQAQMAEIYGVTLAGFQKALARLSIAPKSRGRPGPANGRFRDGTQSTIYRQMIEKRECNRCRSTEQLVVHHRDGVHTNNQPDNLEVLCSPCHTSHHKQEWWDARKGLAS